MTEIIWVDMAELEPQLPLKQKLTPGPLMPWHGGDCPVDAAQIVRCYFRGRRPYVGQAIPPEIPKGSEMWAHAPAKGRTDPRFDIVAYQVMTHG